MFRLSGKSETLLFKLVCFCPSPSRQTLWNILKLSFPCIFRIVTTPFIHKKMHIRSKRHVLSSILSYMNFTISFISTYTHTHTHTHTHKHTYDSILVCVFIYMYKDLAMTPDLWINSTRHTHACVCVCVCVCVVLFVHRLGVIARSLHPAYPTKIGTINEHIPPQ